MYIEESFAGDKKPKKSKKAGKSTKNPCAKFKTGAAAAAGVGAIVGTFTYGIGTAVGAVASSALEQKYSDCMKKQQEKAEKEAEKAAKEAEKQATKLEKDAAKKEAEAAAKQAKQLAATKAKSPGELFGLPGGQQDDRYFPERQPVGLFGLSNETLGMIAVGMAVGLIVTTFNSD